MSVETLLPVSAGVAESDATGLDLAGPADTGSGDVEVFPAAAEPVAWGIAPTLPETWRRRALDVPGWFLPLFISGDDWRKVNARREYGIQAYVGANGGGKSFAAVATVMGSLRTGRRVLSSVRLLDFERPRACPGGIACDDPAGHDVTKDVTEADPSIPYGVLVRTISTGRVHAAAHPLYVPLRTMRQILEWRGGDLLLDEVQGIAGSRTYEALPPEIQTLMLQMRRRDVRLIWTTPAWARADKILREVTSIVTVCSGSVARQRYTLDGERAWRDRRLLTWRTYDAQMMEQWDAGMVETAEPVLTQRVWAPHASVRLAYDTLDAVASVGVVSDSGTCLTCGGGRTRRRCSCPHE